MKTVINNHWFVGISCSLISVFVSIAIDRNFFNKNITNSYYETILLKRSEIENYEIPKIITRIYANEIKIGSVLQKEDIENVRNSIKLLESGAHNGLYKSSHALTLIYKLGIRGNKNSYIIPPNEKKM